MRHGRGAFLSPHLATKVGHVGTPSATRSDQFVGGFDDNLLCRRSRLQLIDNECCIQLRIRRYMTTDLSLGRRRRRRRQVRTPSPSPSALQSLIDDFL